MVDIVMVCQYLWKRNLSVFFIQLANGSQTSHNTRVLFPELGIVLHTDWILSFSSQCKDFFKAGKGVYDDLRRRLPLYPSDFTDGINAFL